MNNLLSLLGLGAVALYFSQKSKETEEALKDLIKKGQDKIDDLDNRTTTLEDDRKYIEEALPVKLQFDISKRYGDNDEYYNTFTTITFTNDSSAVYTIKKVAAVLTLNAGTNEYYAFGKEKTVTIQKGQSAIFQSDWQGQKWFKDIEDARRTNKLLGLDNVIKPATATGVQFSANYIRALVNNGVEDHILTWNAVKGTVKVYRVGYEFPYRVGENAFWEDKYDELL